MARPRNKLTAMEVRRLKAPGRHSDGGGLYLNIAKDGGRRRWVFLYALNGKQREMGLGSADDVSLADARTKAEEARALLARGVDPLERKRAAARAASVPTFGQVADEHIAVMAPRWKNPKHIDQWKMTLGNAYCASIRGKLVSEVATADVLDVLKPIWFSKQETASRLRGRIEAVLDRATVAGHRTGDNPARWRGHLALLLPQIPKLTARGHHAAMPYADVPAFVRLLRLLRGVSALALEFLILTAARSGEVRGAVWSEINAEARVWTIPAHRMKAGREHRVPLTDRALEILHTVAALRRDEEGEGGLVFPGTQRKPLSVMSLTAVLRRNGVGKYTVHGFRSSFRDWVSEQTDHPRELAEQTLAHAIGTASERAYARSDGLEKRRKLMADWAAYLSRVPT